MHVHTCDRKCEAIQKWLEVVRCGRAGKDPCEAVAHKRPHVDAIARDLRRVATGKER